MRATVDPETAVRLLQEEHQAIRQLIDALTPEQMTRPDTIRHGLYPGQKCSFKDLLAHLICYEAYTLEALESWEAGEKHWITGAMRSPALGREVHFGGIAQRADQSLHMTIEEWQTTAAGLDAAIAGFDAESWRQPAPYEDSVATDLGGMIEEIIVAPPRPLYRHLPVHIPDADAYIRSLT